MRRVGRNATIMGAAIAGPQALAELARRQAQEIDDLREQLETEREISKGVQADCRRAEQEHDRVKDQLDDALAQIRPLEQQVETLTGDLTLAREEVDCCDVAFADALRRNNDLTAERDAAAANARNERAYADRIRERYHENRPRCGVVTSPRFYSDEQRYAALRRMIDFWPGIDSYEPIDAVAAALGMRRAAK